MNDQPNRKISHERKAIYTFGLVLMGLGFILFLSTFFILPNTNDFSTPSTANPIRSFALRGVGGIVLIIIGNLLRSIGARGAAGSGVILDPEQARKDVEPWSRMAGGILKDAVDESDIKMGTDSAALDFEEKLRKLESLRQDGLISEEEYQQKRSEIMKENW